MELFLSILTVVAIIIGALIALYAIGYLIALAVVLIVSRRTAKRFIRNL